MQNNFLAVLRTVIYCCFVYVCVISSFQAVMAEKALKRKDHEADDDNSNDEWVGPMPAEASQQKKRKCEFFRIGRLYS